LGENIILERMKQMKKIADEIFYQVYPASFKDSNNDGIGDLKGITTKLPYLKDLGITFLWLSPVYKSPMCDNGYDISDYQAINPMFGEFKDLQELINKAHELDIKVMMDLVINHTSDEHWWFQEALKDPNSKYRNYYIFKKSKQGPPNNWRSNFGAGSAWEKVPNEDDMYYLHVFSKKQPDLNWENEELRLEIYQMINWWIDLGIDGFRVDAITFIKKDQDFASISPDGNDGLGKVKRKTENRPGIEIFLRELSEKCLNKVVTVGETSGLKYDQLHEFIGDNGYFSMAFDFHYVDIDVESGSEWYKRTNWTVKELKTMITKSQETIQGIPGGWGANFFENHDQPRSVSKFIRDEKYQNEIGAKALGMAYFFLKGAPFIYQGQELGMTNFKRQSIEEFNDVSSFNNYERAKQEGYSKQETLNFVNLRSRDNGRVPFQWDDSKNYGFNEGAATYIKINDQCPQCNVATESTKSDSTLNFYKQMIALRKCPELANDLVWGDYQEIVTVPDDVFAYQRGEKIKVFVNLSAQTNEIWVEGEVLLNSYPETIKAQGKVTLKPYQAIMIRED
jgi:alpha-glucosidase